VRTTLTLDEDVADKLKREASRSGSSFRETVNQTLRTGLALRRRVEEQPPFRIEARELGIRPGLDLNNIEELLDQVEGPLRR